MSYIFLEWTEFLVRWLHVIAGIAWIGSSFYFIALDLSLLKRKDIPKEAHGEAWQVHGGGFYQIVKYLVAPDKLPSQLTWFKWEAYATWISGFLLLILIYYISADLYMIEIEKFDLSNLEAISLSLIGIILATIIFSAKRKLKTLFFLDIIACVSPIGIFFGRIANFINSELVGKVTNVYWGVIFPKIDNLIRHPSQLYEAILEGVILFILINYLVHHFFLKLLILGNHQYEDYRKIFEV